MCDGMSLPLLAFTLPPLDADEPFFFLRRIMRGADLVFVGAEAAADGSAAFDIMALVHEIML